MSDTAWLKLALLAEGMAMSESFDRGLGGTEGYVRRRNFYNSPNWPGETTNPLPQEIRLAGEAPSIVAVNNYGSARWRLTWTEEHGPALESEHLDPPRPVELVDDLSALQTDPEVARVSNLYGGSALSFFSPRACYFFAEGTQCHFCSLDGTAKENDEYAARVTPEQVLAAVTAVVSRDAKRLTQVMIVGGNERNLNRGFRHQVALVEAASAALADMGLTDDVSVHLIVMPPADLQLIELLAGIPNLHAGFNLEVWDPERFQQIAPGKVADYGQAAIRNALDKLRDVIGEYRAHSILIAGLEAPETTLAGAANLAESGISPIINSYHSDRHSALGLTIRPRYRELATVASGLQELHDSYPIQPYWKGCGRNALDHEASLGLFRGSAPEFD